MRAAEGIPSARRCRHGRTVGLGWTRELVLIGVLYAGYDLIRVLLPDQESDAIARGLAILHLERVLHLDPEVALNAALSGMRGAALFCDYFYATLHYLVTPAVLIWLYRRHHQNYRFARQMLVAASLIGLACFWLLPTAPPRLLPGGSFIDTMAQWSAYGWWGGAGSVPAGLGHLSNQLAAMPSLHVGWALWCGYYLARLARRRVLRALGVFYPVATTLVVLSTGNHYLLDAVAGALALGVAALLTQLLVTPGRSSPLPVPASWPGPAADPRRPALPASVRRREQSPDLLIACLGKVGVVLAHGAEAPRREHAHHLVGYCRQLVERGRRRDRYSHHDPRGLQGAGGNHRRTHAGTRGQTVVDEHSDSTGKLGRWSVAAVELFSSRQLGLLERGPGGELLTGDPEPLQRCVVDDQHAAGGDRAHRQLAVAGHAHLAYDEHLQLRAERRGDFGRNRYAAARQAEHDHAAPAPGIGRQQPG